MHGTKTRLGVNGRIVLPAAYRRALGMSAGDDLVLILEDDAVRIMSLRATISHAQALIRQYIPVGTVLSNDLLADRRAEAEHD